MLKERSLQAVRVNKLRRSQSESVIELHADEDANIVQQAAAEPQPGTRGDISDEHFAISEAVLDEERAKCQGNWINVGNKQFKETFGTFVELTENTASFQEDEEEEGPKHCQEHLGPNLCKRQLCPRYFAYFDEVVSILREARDVRRTVGYVAHHPPLLFCSSSGSIEHIFLLARISFNPFDATAVEFKMVGDLHAELQVDQDVAVLHRLPAILVRMTEIEETYIVKTGAYTTVSLKEIALKGSSVHQCITAGEAVVEGDGQEGQEENDNEFGPLNMKMTKRHMLRALQGSKASQKKTVVKKKDQKQKPKEVGKKGPNKGSSKSDKDIALEDPGKSDIVDSAILKEWGGALAEQLGPIVANPSSASSASSERKPSTPSENKPVSATPIMSYTQPWRDAKGYCWTYKAETGKAYPLGHYLSIFFSTGISVAIDQYGFLVLALVL